MKNGLDVRRIIDDLGGVVPVAEACGTVRTAPYRWMRTGKIPHDALMAIMDLYKSIKHSDLKLQEYRNA